MDKILNNDPFFLKNPSYPVVYNLAHLVYGSFLLLSLLLLLTSCEQHPARIKGIAMTIPYSIQIGDSHPDLKKVESLIQATFSEIDQIYNNWNPHSEISSLNLLPAVEKHEISLPLASFLHRVNTLVLLTEGRFDPTIAPVKKGLLEGNFDIDPSCVGWDKIHIEGCTFWKDHPALTLDLGGVAKGYAVDLLIERLKEAGYRQLFVEWGGELHNTGDHPKGRPWIVAIRGGDVLELKDQAIATSGSYVQQWTFEEQTYTHIIDPMTKKPLSEGVIMSASVVCDTCMEADAIATALMLFPSLEEGYAWAEKKGLKIWLF